MKIAACTAVVGALLQLLVAPSDAVGFGDLTNLEEAEVAESPAPLMLADTEAPRVAPVPSPATERRSEGEEKVETRAPTLDANAAESTRSSPARGDDIGNGDDADLRTSTFDASPAPIMTPGPVPMATLRENEDDDDRDDDSESLDKSTTTPIVPTPTPGTKIRGDDEDDDEESETPTPTNPSTAPVRSDDDADTDDIGDSDDTPHLIIPPASTRTPTPAPVLAEDAPDIFEEAPASSDDAPDVFEGRSQTGNQPWKQNTNQGPATDSEPNVSNGGVNLYPYTDEIRNYIVDQHNYARATMVPLEAANMRKLGWNEALAIEASELVNTCVFAHDTENYAYGQNLMYGNMVIDKSTVEDWMKAWVENEISPGDRTGQGYMDLDHASAVLWAKSYYVGCASKMCPNGYLTACNYFSPGNMMGEQAFVPGPPCSQCPSQAKFCDAQYGKLCTANPSESGSPIQRPPSSNVNPAIQRPPPAPAPANQRPPSSNANPAIQRPLSPAPATPAKPTPAKTGPGSSPLPAATGPASSLQPGASGPASKTGTAPSTATGGVAGSHAGSSAGINGTSVQKPTPSANGTVPARVKSAASRPFAAATTFAGLVAIVMLCH